jgi:hypothetical protein
MAVNYVKGQILASNLERDGIDLSISNAKVGIGTLFPSATLEVVGNVVVGNVSISNIGTISAVSNITGGNILSNAAIIGTTLDISSNATVGNLSIDSTSANLILYTDVNNNIVTNANLGFNGNLLQLTGTANVSANINAGNIGTSGNITATGNIQGGNVISDGAVIGNVEISGNLTVTNLTVLELLSGNNVSISNTITATGNLTGGNVLTGGLISATGNVTGGNLNTSGQVVALGNIIGGNLLLSDNLYANVFVGNTVNVATIIASNSVSVGNKVIPAVGNIDVANVNIVNLSDPAANQDAATKYYVDNQIDNIGNLGNLTFSNTTISTSLTNGNITLASTGTEYVIITGTGAVIIPNGNIAQRPTSPVPGMIRVNTELGQVEGWDGNNWVSGSGYNITNETLVGDGSTVTFVLNRTTSTAGTLVMLNGVVQRPVTAYSISPSPGNTLIFTEAPAISDIIDIRYL